MTGLKPFIKAGWLGIATIAFSLLLQSVSPKSGGLKQNGFTNPVLQFEFAESKEDVIALFTFGSPSEKETFQTKMKRSVWFDFVFMFLYNGFLFLLGWTCYLLSQNRLFLFILPLAVLAFAGDLMENLQLLRLTEAVDDGRFGHSVLLLRWFTWLKWGALAVIMSLLGLWLIKGNTFSKILAAVGFIVPVLAVIAFFDPGTKSELFSLGIALMFLGMTIYSFIFKQPSDNKIKKTAAY